MEIQDMRTKHILEKISSREISATEVLDIYLKRIDDIDSEINAFVQVLESSARADARELDSLLEKGENPGILAGLPIAIKDNICVEGAGCTCGSAMMENWMSPYDATVIKRLRKHGAIIIGKTNMDEFAMGSSTETSAYGSTANPWDLSRVPGGSSGGSAAAVAAGMAPLALGTDTGGSIRQPASFTGICGVKPSYGLVSRFGVAAYASSLDTVGPMTETVWDCALVLEAIAGNDNLDATSSSRESVSYTKNLDKNVETLRVGYPKELLEGVSVSVKDKFIQSLKVMEDMGMVVEEISIPSIIYAGDVYYIIATAEGASNLSRFDGVRFGKRASANSLDTMYTRSRTHGFGKEAIKRILFGTLILGSGYKERYYMRAARIRTLIKREFENIFERFDLIVSPASPEVAFKIGGKQQEPLSVHIGDLLTLPVNLANLCALSLPMGLVDLDDTRLPCGLQIIGKPYGEQTVLNVGYSLEDQIGSEVYHERSVIRRKLNPTRECELVD